MIEPFHTCSSVFCKAGSRIFPQRFVGRCELLMRRLCIVVFRSVLDVCPWNYVVMVSVVFKILINILLLLSVNFQCDFFFFVGGGREGDVCVKTTALVKFAQHTGQKTPHDAVAPWTESTVQYSTEARTE